MLHTGGEGFQVTDFEVVRCNIHSYLARAADYSRKILREEKKIYYYDKDRFMHQEIKKVNTLVLVRIISFEHFLSLCYL